MVWETSTQAANENKVAKYKNGSNNILGGLQKRSDFSSWYSRYSAGENKILKEEQSKEDKNNVMIY